MNDTDPKIVLKYQELLMAKSSQERLLMGCSMYDAAKKIAKSSLSDDPDISEAQVRRALFLRFYGMEFKADERERISESIGA